MSEADLAERPGVEPATPVDEATLRTAQLNWSSDALPGIARRRSGRGFAYRAPDGAAVRDPETLARIRSLAIPPGWRRVWISPDPDGHIQAVGRDERNRKQYRYHPRWQEVRDQQKFDRILAFAEALPRIRERVEKDLARPGLGREKVLALVVTLLESTLIRVGNDEYARTNKTYGLTTLRDRHVKVEGAELRFRFRGKGGKLHEIGLRDRRLARLVRATQELPGQELLQWLDADGTPCPVSSTDVNAYLKEIAGEAFTAKDFRTWAATVVAAWTLIEVAPGDGGGTKKHLAAAIAKVAQRLGHTPAVCRKSYVHPEILNAYHAGELLGRLDAEDLEDLAEGLEGLDREERAVLAFLRARLQEAA